MHGRGEFIIIENGITSVGAYAFSGCDSLENITINVENEIYIGNNAFYDCPNLSDINIHGGDVAIDYDAFHDSDDLNSIIIKATNTIEIAADAFCRCYSSNVIISGDVIYIDSYGFHDCTFTDMSIEGEAVYIASWCFQGCQRLENITFSTGFIYIDEEAFADCISLTDVYYYGTEEEWSDSDKVEIVESGNEYLLSATIHYLGSSSAITGECGDSLTWSLDSDGSLNISGTGEMWGYKPRN